MLSNVDIFYSVLNWAFIRVFGQKIFYMHEDQFENRYKKNICPHKTVKKTDTIKWHE